MRGGEEENQSPNEEMQKEIPTHASSSSSSTNEEYNKAPLWLTRDRENELLQAHSNLIGAGRKSMSLAPRRAKKRESLSELMKKADDFHGQHIDINVKSYVSDTAVSTTNHPTEHSFTNNHNRNNNLENEDHDCAIQSPTRSQPSSPFIMNSSLLASVQLKKSPALASKTIDSGTMSPPAKSNNVDHSDTTPPRFSKVSTSGSSSSNNHNHVNSGVDKQEPALAKPPIFKGNQLMAENFQSELSKKLSQSSTETLRSPKNKPTTAESVFDVNSNDVNSNLSNNLSAKQSEANITVSVKSEKTPESPKTVHKLKIPSIFSSTLEQTSKSDSTPKKSIARIDSPKEPSFGNNLKPSPTINQEECGQLPLKTHEKSELPETRQNSPLFKLPIKHDSNLENNSPTKNESCSIPQHQPPAFETATTPTKSLKDKIAELENKSKLSSPSAATTNQVDFRSVLKKRSNNNVL
ncbi:hypothetical protein C9374_011103 [Naegleria lovaniensis]|uniref:Uncharacterized protein n=1 Tax=Naegleria lovaniensis TaxID=51637 RepID=A0AA88GG73_NAELO|nr:uncharacterized protein C9374_011103 [Naegleria lovaniensis]KAG2374024.1 hypothetical protein C9374_011103 [Naegleria lovaniensis]